MRWLPYPGIDLSVRYWRLLPKPLANLVILNPSDLGIYIYYNGSFQHITKLQTLVIGFTVIWLVCNLYLKNGLLGHLYSFVEACALLLFSSMLLFNHVCESFVVPCLWFESHSPLPHYFPLKEVRYLALRKGHFSFLGESFSFGQRGIESAC